MRLLLDARLMAVDWKARLDQQNNARDAELQDASGSVLRLLWPDAEIDQHGVFFEGKKAFGANDVFKAGLRYDHINAAAGRPDEVNGGLSAQQIWSMAGAPAGAGEEKSEHNVNGFASWTHRINDHYTFDSVLSRSVRTAEATERYIARTTMTSDWIGNPELEPEKHHQFEVSLHYKNGATHWSATGWYNRVEDYILRQTVAAGMKPRDSYRNVSAELYGAELQVQHQLNSEWALAGALVWTVGNNRDNDTALSRIAPLELTTSLDYEHDKLKAGLVLRLVDQQNDICLSGAANCGGQDVRKTPGYGVVDVHVTYTFGNRRQAAGGC